MNYTINNDRWIMLFDINNNEPLLTKKQFFKLFKVSTNKNIYHILDYLQKLKDYDKRIKDVEIFINIYNNKNEYLNHFFNNSLKIMDYSFEELYKKQGNKPLISNNLKIKAKNLIRNLHFNNILMNTQTDLRNLKPFLKIIYDLFINKTIDYKLITPSILDLIHKYGLNQVMSGIYFRASIMNPYLVFNISKMFIHNPNSKIFTPTLGWSSYLYGFMEDNNVSEYLGIDVINDVCLKSKDYFKEKYPNKKINIICSPSEVVYKNKNIITPLKSYFDLVFFSPPYFKLELYPGELQSTTMYPEYNEWLNEYWENTIKLCYYVLKRNHYFIYILSGYGSKNSETIKINTDMNNITNKYFKYHSEIPMVNSNVGFTKHKKSNEIIYIFKKIMNSN